MSYYFKDLLRRNFHESAKSSKLITYGKFVENVYDGYDLKVSRNLEQCLLVREGLVKLHRGEELRRALLRKNLTNWSSSSLTRTSESSRVKNEEDVAEDG